MTTNKPIDLNTSDADARKMTVPIDRPSNRAKLTVDAIRTPWLDARNAKRAAHPLVQGLTACRKRAITAMLQKLADAIHRDAGRAAVADDMMHLWPTSFFRAAAQQGITMEVRIEFTRGLAALGSNTSGEELNQGVRVQVSSVAEDFAGCEPLPLEVELAHNIASEEP